MTVLVNVVINRHEYFAKEMTGVVERDLYGGITDKYVGVFDKQCSAEAWVKQQGGFSKGYGIRNVTVLTNGRTAYIITGYEVKLLDNEKGDNALRSNALAKLSPEEQDLLGVSQRNR